MAAEIYRRNNCRACSSQDLELVLKLEPTPIGDAFVTADRLSIPQPVYPIDLHMCGNCGLAQLIDVIDPRVLYGEYIYVTSSSVGLSKHFNEYADSVITRCRLPPASLVVDIGSNDGTLLRSFADKGMTVLGVEPASHIAAAARTNGINTIDQFFDKGLAKRIVDEFGFAKVVTANNVFANIDDLTTWVEAINGLLASDGVFIFESYYLLDLLSNMVFDFIYHEHLSAFSIKPIQKLFASAGLELIAAQRVSTKGGSLRFFVQRPGGPLINDGSVLQLLNEEEKMGLYRKEKFANFADRIQTLKIQLHDFLSQAKREGKSIAGFGASITGTTLIYHFEIGEYLDFLVDDNPAKQGRFSPGLHLPVLSSSALYERKPDLILILAWRFAEPFISNNRKFLHDGGQFIVPVPEFRIVSNG